MWLEWAADCMQVDLHGPLDRIPRKIEDKWYATTKFGPDGGRAEL